MTAAVRMSLNDQLQEAEVQNASDALTASGCQLSVSSTGLIYDDAMQGHHCPWDAKHIETPARLSEIWSAICSYGLENRCVRLPTRAATEEEIGLVHDAEYIRTVAATQNMSDEELEKCASQFQDVYFSKETYALALMAAGSTLNAVEAVLNGNCNSAFALVRPPGHHSWSNQANGFCVFNNAAIAARYALKKFELERILIVDFDVHHGQGVQYTFSDDPRVLYLSAHRYQCGSFWPNLRESAVTAVGRGEGHGFNINFPLNRTGLAESEYFAIIDQVLMPVALEFQPELVLVCAGFDAALGDPEGLMQLTPAFYGHLTRRLQSLANGKVCCVLEGGYCLSALADCVAQTLRALLGESCLSLPCHADRELAVFDPSCCETLFALVLQLAPFWRCMKAKLDVLRSVFAAFGKVLAPTEREFLGDTNRMYPKEPPYPTRGMYKPQTQEEKDVYRQKIVSLAESAKQRGEFRTPKYRTAFGYDERMLKHYDHFRDHPESPARIDSIVKALRKRKLIDERCLALQGRLATGDELQLVHKLSYIEHVRNVGDGYIDEVAGDNPTYTSKDTFEAASVAVGTLLNVVDAVVGDECLNGFAMIRPPGHHIAAQHEYPYGFCVFNNVAIAARYAKTRFPDKVKKILIFDWDVHFGDGTSDTFLDDPSVLYVSLHRFESGAYFPALPKKGCAENVGEGGCNVNIPWESGGKTDSDYLLAFYQIVLPIVYEFSPDLVLVCAGFDAGVDDPLGQCHLSPDLFAHFAQVLGSLAQGRIILALEGGYNVQTLKHCAVACMSALLNEPCAMPKFSAEFLSADTLQTLSDVVKALIPHWRCFGSMLNATNSFQPLSAISSASSSCAFASPKEEPYVCLKISDATASDEITELYAVTPLSECPHLSAVQPLPTSTPADIATAINLKQACAECGHQGENWICLTCFTVHCSRYVNGHAQLHSDDTTHPMALSFADLSVWCYVCSDYVSTDNPTLHPAYTAAHCSKFGANAK